MTLRAKPFRAIALRATALRARQLKGHRMSKEMYKNFVNYLEYC